MLHSIVYLTVYQLILNKKQREALRSLSAKRRNIFQRFSRLVQEIFFDNDQTILASHSRIEAYWRSEQHMETFRTEKEDIENLKSGCHQLGIPAWIIRYEMPS